MEYTFIWYIQNYSHCFHKCGDYLESPEFSPVGLNGSSWTLELYPRGETEELRGGISLFLCRSEEDEGPEMMLVKHELSILDADGSIGVSEIQTMVFYQGESSGYTAFTSLDPLRFKSEYLPQDTLTVRCKMWWGEDETVREIRQCTARTRIAIQKVSFLHLVEDFSALGPHRKSSFKVRLGEIERCIVSSVHCTDRVCCGDDEVIVAIEPTAIQFISECKFSLIDASGNKIECGRANDRFESVEDEIVTLPLSLTKNEIMDRKEEFLQDDKLSLVCECVFATGCEFESIEDVVLKIPVTAVKLLDTRESTEKPSQCTDALDDLRAIYCDQLFTDVVIQTKTRSFPAHKMVLFARCPAFPAILGSDKELKDCDIIKTEMEDDILEPLLLFLYSNKLEGISFETAVKLYKVAANGKIEKLKEACLNFLEDNLDAFSAAEFLSLTNVHDVAELKQVVEAYNLEHHRDVFGSEEWKHLVEINPHMYQIIRFEVPCIQR